MSGIPKTSKDEFWDVVEDCLIEIHQLDPRTAKRKCEGLRGKIESQLLDSVPAAITDIFYHAEPFDVACDIAQNHLNIHNYRSTYNKILDKHHW